MTKRPTVVVIEDGSAFTKSFRKYPGNYPIATSVRKMTLLEYVVYRFRQLSQKRSEIVGMHPGEHKRSVGVQISDAAWAQITGAVKTSCSREPALMELLAPARVDTTPFDSGDRSV